MDPTSLEHLENSCNSRFRPILSDIYTDKTEEGATKAGPRFAARGLWVVTIKLTADGSQLHGR